MGEASTPDSECTLRSMSFTFSALSNVCWSGKRAKSEEVFGLRTGHTYIVVLYQDRYRAYDRLQWKE